MGLYLPSQNTCDTCSVPWGNDIKTHQCAAYQNTTIPLAQTSLGSFLWYLYSTLVPKQAYVAVFVSWWIFCCAFFAEIIGVPLGRIYRVTFWAWWWAALYGRKPPKGPKAISMTSAVSWTFFFSVSWVLEETKNLQQQLVIQMDYAWLCQVLQCVVEIVLFLPALTA